MAGGNVTPQLAPLFQAAGAQYKIPPEVLAGIASVETNLGQNIRPSSAGAQGLMQFMPGTARGLGVNPADARSAIFGAAKLLNQYGYQQNPLRAIGAYNGGPGNPQMGYASQVMSESKRLAGQLGSVAKQRTGGTGASIPAASAGGTDVAGAGIAALMAAANKPINMSGKVSASDPLSGLANNIASGKFSTGTIGPTGVRGLAVATQAVNDAAAAGANADAQKLLRMLHFVQGAPYSQGNHDAINQNQFAVKARGTDCSGLISWLMGPQGLGIWHSSLATPNIPNAPGLQPGKGSTVTVWNNNQAGNAGHVFIQVGNTYFASEGGAGVRQLPISEVRMYLTQGSDGGHYQAFHPKGL